MNLKILLKKRVSKTLILCIIATFLQFFVYKFFFVSFDNNLALKNKKATLMATKEIKRGSRISEENTKIVYMVSQGSLEAYIPNIEFSQFSQKDLLVDVPAYSPLLKQFFPLEEQTLTPNSIPLGHRLFGINVESSPLNDFVQVGDRVDVLAHLKIDGFGDATETILNGARVVSISSQGVFHFYLTPEEVKIISFMKPRSQFLLSLRNPHDTAFNDLPPMTFNQFLQNKKIQKIINNDTFRIVPGFRSGDL